MGLALRKPQSAVALYSEADYLARERAAAERSEYLDGVIYAMAGESRTHAKASVNLVRLIDTHLLGRNCDLFTKDTKVRSGPLPKSRTQTKGLYSYPDLVVVCGEPEYLDDYQDVLTNPTVIIEVLSNSTERFDSRQKFLRYQQYLPSLVDYVLVTQDSPTIEVFHRVTAKAPRWEYTVASGLRSHIVIPSLKCTLRLADVYYRVPFPAAVTTKTGRKAKLDSRVGTKKNSSPATKKNGLDRK